MANEVQNKQNVIEIQMLGDFSIRFNNQILSGDKLRGKQVWNLLEYIMVNRNKEISLDRVIQALWNDDVEDPANALKNLAYRLRVTLKNSLNIQDECILYKHGAYTWNKDIPCVIDVDILESAYKETLQNSLSEDDLMLRYQKIVETYKGNFLPQSNYKEWVIPLTIYYQRIYMESVERYCEILLMSRDYKTVEEVCRQAIMIDPFVEANHAFLIRSYVGANNYEKANDHYNYVNKLFYDELGVKPSELISNLYHKIKNTNTIIGQDINVIKGDLKEIDEIHGAIYCNYQEFKMLYQLEARASLRSGKSIFIALLTVTGKSKLELPKHNLDQTFEKIKNAIVHSLRKDDIVTRYGRTQFLLMLANISYENSTMVLNRLVNRINDSGIHNQVEVYGQLQSLDPIELEDINVSV